MGYPKGQRWSIDFDDQEIRAEEDGCVLFDVHNATDEESLIAAAAPAMFDALRAAAVFFEGTDAPTGEIVRAAIAQATGLGQKVAEGKK